MHPRATKVAFAAKPVALGVALVPVIVTVLLLYAVVKPVPSNAASRINKSSTDACVKAQLVMITLPSTLRKVLPSVNVVSAAVPLMIFTDMLEDEPITSITGKVKDVNAAIVAGAIRPDVKTVLAKFTPMLVKAGRSIVVREAIVAGL